MLIIGRDIVEKFIYIQNQVWFGYPAELHWHKEKQDMIHIFVPESGFKAPIIKILTWSVFPYILGMFSVSLI